MCGTAPDCFPSLAQQPARQTHKNTHKALRHLQNRILKNMLSSIFVASGIQYEQLCYLVKTYIFSKVLKIVIKKVCVFSLVSFFPFPYVLNYSRFIYMPLAQHVLIISVIYLEWTRSIQVDLSKYTACCGDDQLYPKNKPIHSRRCHHKETNGATGSPSVSVSAPKCQCWGDAICSR